MSTPAKASKTLTLAVLIALALLLAINTITKERIAKAQQDFLLSNLSAVLPDEEFDNDPIDSMFQHIAPQLGTDRPLSVYPVYRSGQPLASVLELIAPDGYSGSIRILLGVYFSGEIIAARVVQHKETPGLGDDIEHRKSDWILQFNGQSISTKSDDSSQLTPNQSWRMRRDGGQYDAITGATITSQAVVRAIHRALEWYDKNKDQVFAS